MVNPDSDNLPPPLAQKLLTRFLRNDLAEEVLGDLDERFYATVKEKSAVRAKLNYWYETINYLRPFALQKSRQTHLNHYDMLENYFKVSVRNILKYKVFSFINVFGLAVAMSVCMLIILMLTDQNRYDQFHEKKNRIYRITSNSENSRQAYATSPLGLAAALEAEYPMVETATSLSPGVGGDVIYEQKLTQMRGYFAEPTFFTVFSFDLLKGNKATALASPNSIVITSQLAYELFNTENPMGKVVEFSDRNLSFPIVDDGLASPAVPWGSFTITGIIDQNQHKSHLKFDALVSASSMHALYQEKKMEDRSADWENYFRTYTYVLLEPGKKEKDLNSALKNFADRKYASIQSEQTKGFVLKAQALTDVQLGLLGNDTNNRLPLVGYYFLAFLAIVIMLSATLNYVSLTVARALTRAKEIGIRKVTGADKKSLIIQFLSESIIISLIAMLLAFLFLQLIGPAFKSLWINKYLNFELAYTFSAYGFFLLFAVFIGAIAGLYPALHLSNYQPVKALKNFSFGAGKIGIRKFLNVTQFIVSLFFIITSIVIFNQFKHFMQFDYGFNSKNIVNIELQGANYKKVANEMSAVQGVIEVSASDLIPATGTNNGIQLKKMGSAGDYAFSSILHSDLNFAANLGIMIIAGKSLPESDSSNQILVNEAFVREFGYPTPEAIVGEIFETRSGNLQVAGVIKDFHYRLLINKDGVKPLVLRSRSSEFKFLNIKIAGSLPMKVLEAMEVKWKQIDALHPFQYKFFDDELANTNQAIFDLVAIMGFISFLAIIIACLGLLGMSTYNAERKTKEIGVRKVLGASETNISILLSKEFIKLLALSVLIGAPSSYFLNNLWLQQLSTRVEFGFGTMLLGISLMMAMGLLTVGSQALRASKRNPIESLKTE